MARTLRLRFWVRRGALLSRISSLFLLVLCLLLLRFLGAVLPATELDPFAKVGAVLPAIQPGPSVSTMPLCLLVLRLLRLSTRSGLSPLGSSALVGSTKITDLLPLAGVPDELPRPSNSGYASSTRASCLASLRAVPLASRASCASFERFPRLFFFGPVVRPFLKQCGASRNCFVARFYPQPLVMRG